MASSNYEWKNKLPMGFQFVPTDKELNMYLKLKSCNGKIPPGIFSDLDIYNYEPQQLDGIVEKHCGGRMYIFTQLQKKYSTGKKIKRTIHSGKGFWKASQARKEIPKKHNLDKQTCESSFQLAKEEEKGDTKIGTKTSLVYYKNLKSTSGKKSLKSSSGKRTSWLMSEYRFPEKLDTQPLFNETDHELTLCVIYYNDTKKDNDGQLAMLSESDPIPPQISVNQSFDHSPYTFPIPNNPNYNYYHNTSPPENLYSCSSFDPNCAPFRQYKPLINRVAASLGEEWSIELNYTDVAITSTMHPGFPQLSYRGMENLDIFSSIPQNFDIHEFGPSMSQHINVDNFDFTWDEEIGHIPNSNVDQNKFDAYVAPTSQDDQSSQDHQQLKMKKIKLSRL